MKFHLRKPVMTPTRKRRLKTLTGASSVISASNDTTPSAGAKRAVELARKAEAQKITGLFTADLLHIDPAGLAGTAGIQGRSSHLRRSARRRLRSA
ncbi:hypothetical protein ACOJBO_01880 [Rhizobium beringeri]